jgi:hypothetical protein
VSAIHTPKPDLRSIVAMWIADAVWPAPREMLNEIAVLEQRHSHVEHCRPEVGRMRTPAVLVVRLERLLDAVGTEAAPIEPPRLSQHNDMELGLETSHEAERESSRRPGRTGRSPAITSSTRWGETSPSSRRSIVSSTASCSGAEAIEYERDAW